MNERMRVQPNREAMPECSRALYPALASWRTQKAALPYASQGGYHVWQTRQVTGPSPGQRPPGHNLGRISVSQPRVEMTVRQPGDPAEQQAEHMASQAMRIAALMPSITTVTWARQDGLQRKCAACEESGQPCPACQEEGQNEHEPLARNEPGDTGTMSARSPHPEDLLEPSSGQPLDAETRAFMEPRFGHDFSQVRVHTDARASESAEAVNALAYTVGPHVVFRSGQYTPGTSAGQRLLAHELTHVVQQGAGPLPTSIHALTVQRMEQGPEEEHRARIGLSAEEPGAEERAVTVEDAEEPSVEPVPTVRGEGEPEEVVAYGNTSLRLRGRTHAAYRYSFRTTDEVTEAGTGCRGCRGPNCVHVTGTLITDYAVNTRVTLPRVSQFRRLTPCQRERVQDAIDTVLAPHEQKHVDAFNTYNGTTEQPFDLTVCRAALPAAIRAMVSAEQRPRRAAAQSASDNLDPYYFDVDLDCDEPRPNS
jgi:Domain of unknown function (DUF4157)